MSLRKWCGPTFPPEHPLHCKRSPDCDHFWFYDFRVNRRRYRATTIVRYLDNQGRALRHFEVCDHHAELTIRREQLRGLKVNDLRRSP